MRIIGIRVDRAAVIGLTDLELLESPTSEALSENENAEKEEQFKRALKEAGIEVAWPSGEPITDRPSAS